MFQVSDTDQVSEENPWIVSENGTWISLASLSSKNESVFFFPTPKKEKRFKANDIFSKLWKLSTTTQNDLGVNH